jgi:hypothetical protein
MADDLRVFERTGDGALVEFRSAVEAVRCAITIQNAMIERNVGMPEDQRMLRVIATPQRQSRHILRCWALTPESCAPCNRYGFALFRALTRVEFPPGIKDYQEALLPSANLAFESLR